MSDLNMFITAVFVSVVVAIAAAPTQADTPVWFTYAEVYLGVDQSFREWSPQCLPGKYSQRATSNIGFRMNVYQSKNSRFHTNLKTTHHSCVFNSDFSPYDSIGIEIIFRPFNRR